MLRRFLRSKLHQARVTETNLHYEGSLTVDLDLADAAGMHVDEQVEVYNISNGKRFTTYVIAGERGSGVIGVNGAAAHMADVGDSVIVVTYCDLSPEEIASHRSTVLILDENNSIRSRA